MHEHEHKNKSDEEKSSILVISAVPGKSSSIVAAATTDEISIEIANQSNVTIANTSSSPSNCTSALKFQTMLILYLSSFAIIGSTIRQYLSRIFVEHELELEPDHELTHNHQNGAIFIALPANMLGCLLMGLMIPMKKHTHIPTLPWLKAHHPMQSNHNIHAALQTALCGSLTSFSSWNSQMVIMLLGMQEEEVEGGPSHSQAVVQALMGYLLGIICTISSFQFGRHLGRLLVRWRGGTDAASGASASAGASMIDGRDQGSTPLDRTTGEEGDIISGNRSRWGERCSACTNIIIRTIAALFDIILHGTYSPFFFVAMLLILFFVGDFAMHNSFHKELWVSAILSPPGTLLRWKLGQCNGKWFQNSHRWRYIPFGTFAANVMGCIVSIASAAALFRLHDHGKVSKTEALWLGGIKTGFAGNLSTVSSFVKEIVLLSEKNELGAAYLYAIGSVVICCLVGSVVYVIIIKV